MTIKRFSKNVRETPYCYFWVFLRNIWLHGQFVYIRGKLMKSAGDTVTAHQELQALQRLCFFYYHNLQPLTKNLCSLEWSVGMSILPPPLKKFETDCKEKRRLKAPKSLLYIMELNLPHLLAITTHFSWAEVYRDSCLFPPLVGLSYGVKQFREEEIT